MTSLNFKKVLLSAFLITSVSAIQAEQFNIRVPVLAAEHPPETLNFSLGTVRLGAEPRISTFFVNKGAEPTTVELVKPFDNAKILLNECQGAVLKANEKCTLELSLISTSLGSVAGRVQVHHSKAVEPNIYSLTAQVVPANSGLRFDEVLLDFGNQSMNTSVLRKATLRNTSSDSFFILNTGFNRSSIHFKLLRSNCIEELAPGAFCEMDFEFKPSLRGNTSVQVFYELEDGTKISDLTLTGQGVIGSLSLNNSELIFNTSSTSQTSAPQPVILTNNGNGPLKLNSFVLKEGDIPSTSFRISRSTCPVDLSPGQNCILEVEFKGASEGSKFGFLEINTANAQNLSYKVQLTGTVTPMVSSIEADPLSIDFGTTGTNTSVSKTVAVRSIGSANLTVSSYSITGSNASDFSITNPSSCIGALAPSMECILNLSLNSSQPGSKTAYLNINSNDPKQPRVLVPLSGFIASGTITLEPYFINFPSTNVGQEVENSFKIKNISQYPVSVSKIAVRDVTNFRNSNSCVKTLAPQEECSIAVTFSPKSIKNFSSFLDITSNSSTPLLSPQISGVALAALTANFNVSPFQCETPVQTASCSTFGCQTPNVVCKATLTNTGGLPLSSIQHVVNNPQARISGCSTTLNPTNNCELTLQAVRNVTGPFFVVYTATSGGKSVSSTATVNVIDPSLDLKAVPHSNLTVNQSNEVTHSLTNNGVFDVNVNSVSLGASSALKLKSHNCPSTLRVNQSCNIITTCSSTNAGSFSVPLTVASLKSISKPVSCQVSAPSASVGSLVFNPSPLDFGRYAVDVLQNRSVSLRNTNPTSTPALSLSTFSIVGENSSEFSIVSRTCKTSLVSGSSCSINISHKPTSPGVKQAILRVSSSGQNVDVPLRGIALTGSVFISPQTLDLGSNPVNVRSPSKSATITNNGEIPVTLTKMTLTGSTDFTGSGCVRNTVLQPGMSCTLAYSALAKTVGVKESNVLLEFSNKTTPLNLSLKFLATEPLAPRASATLECPPLSSTDSSFVNCTSRVTSTGTANLKITSLNSKLTTPSSASRAVMVTSWNCSAGSTISNLIPGSACTATISVPIATAGKHLVSISPLANATIAPLNAEIDVKGPEVEFFVENHPTQQVSETSTREQILLNKSSVVARVFEITRSNGQLGTPNFINADCSVINPGKTCKIRTTCTSNKAGVLKTDFTVKGNFGTITKTVSCEVEDFQIEVTPLVSIPLEYPSEEARPAPLRSYNPFILVGGTGNWYKIINKGKGPVTLRTVVNADLLPYQLKPGSSYDYVNQAPSSHIRYGNLECKNPQVIQVGSYCLMYIPIAVGDTYFYTQVVAAPAYSDEEFNKPDFGHYIKVANANLLNDMTFRLSYNPAKALREGFFYYLNDFESYAKNSPLLIENPAVVINNQVKIINKIKAPFIKTPSITLIKDFDPVQIGEKTTAIIRLRNTTPTAITGASLTTTIGNNNVLKLDPKLGYGFGTVNNTCMGALVLVGQHCDMTVEFDSSKYSIEEALVNRLHGRSFVRGNVTHNIRYSSRGLVNGEENSRSSSAHPMILLSKLKVHPVQVSLEPFGPAPLNVPLGATREFTYKFTNSGFSSVRLKRAPHISTEFIAQKRDSLKILRTTCTAAKEVRPAESCDVVMEYKAQSPTLDMNETLSVSYESGSLSLESKAKIVATVEKYADFKLSINPPLEAQFLHLNKDKLLTRVVVENRLSNKSEVATVRFSLNLVQNPETPSEIALREIRSFSCGSFRISSGQTPQELSTSRPNPAICRLLPNSTGLEFELKLRQGQKEEFLVDLSSGSVLGQAKLIGNIASQDTLEPNPSDNSQEVTLRTSPVVNDFSVRSISLDRFAIPTGSSGLNATVHFTLSPNTLATRAPDFAKYNPAEARLVLRAIPLSGNSPPIEIFRFTCPSVLPQGTVCDRNTGVFKTMGTTGNVMAASFNLGVGPQIGSFRLEAYLEPINGTVDNVPNNNLIRSSEIKRY